MFCSQTQTLCITEQTTGAPAPPPPPPPSSTTTLVDRKGPTFRSPSPTSWTYNKGHTIADKGLFASLTTCACMKIHFLKMLHPSSGLTIHLPPTQKDEKQSIHPSQQPTVTWSWQGGSHTMELAPCWIYHFYSNGQIQLIRRCEHKQQQEMTLQEKMLALEIVTAVNIVNLAKQHGEPLAKWPEWIAKRLGGIHFAEVNKVCQTLSTTKEKGEFFIKCMDSDLINRQSRQINVSVLADISKTLSPLSIEVETRLQKLCQTPYTLVFQ